MSFIEIRVSNDRATPVQISKNDLVPKAANDFVSRRRQNQTVGSFSTIPADERDEFARLLDEAFAGL